VRTGEIEWNYPILGFTPDGDIWGFPDREALTVCGSKTLKDNMQADMELVDATGQSWRVLSVRRTGAADTLLNRLMFLGKRLWRIEHELEALPAVGLAETLVRVCKGMEANPGYWSDDDEVSDELRALQAEVRAIKSIAGIHDVLGLDWFADY
jgi:hypothetical protein